MGRHRRDSEDEDVSGPTSASELLAAAGYGAPGGRRRRDAYDPVESSSLYASPQLGVRQEVFDGQATSVMTLGVESRGQLAAVDDDLRQGALSGSPTQTSRGLTERQAPGVLALRDATAREKSPPRTVSRDLALAGEIAEIAEDIDLEEKVDDYEDMQLGREWTIYCAQLLAAACCGLVLWMGSYLLWRNYPYLAVMTTVIALVGMLAGTCYVHHRRHPDEPLDFFTVGVVLGVGVLLTVLPVAFVLRPM